MTPSTRLLVLALSATSTLIGAFVLTAPWLIAQHSVSRLTIMLFPLALTLLLALLIPSWRSYLATLSDRAVSRAQLFWFTLFVGLTLTLRVVLAQYAALAVNAWDFSAFELPVQRTLTAGLLYSPFEHRSFLGTHASYLLVVFVPLYAIVQSHYWMLIAHAISIALAAAFGSILFAEILDDNVAGGLVGLAFLLNSYTAKIVQYPFHIEVFYPLGVFLLVYAIRRDRIVAAVGAAVLLLSLKEDATVTIVGVACALLLSRPRRFVLPAILVSMALAAYAVSAYVVMPRVSGSPPGHAWYASMWSQYGADPARAVLGMAAHPVSVIGDLSRSGIRHLLETLIFIPLAGWPWLVAAVPGLLVYGVAGGGEAMAAQFSVYYSAPVLPTLFVAAAFGICRLSAIWKRGPRRHRLRAIALIVCLVSALDGASYVFRAPNPRRRDVLPLTRMLKEDIEVQGSLLPHADFDEHVRPFVDLGSKSKNVLLDLDSDPYPFRRADLEAIVARCREDASCHVTVSRHGLVQLRRDPG